MLVLPIRTPGHVADMLVIVLGPDGLARLKAADPAEVKVSDLGVDLVNPTVLICYEEPGPELTRRFQTADIGEQLKWLTRGWSFKPGDGDRPRSLYEGQ